MLIKDGYKTYKQPAWRMETKVIAKVKEEIEQLLQASFIRTSRYVDWFANIVPIIKMNAKLRIALI